MPEDLKLDSWILHNNKVVNENLEINDLEEDKLATKMYFKEYINKHYQHFGSLEEKIRYLVYDNDYWEREFIEKYTIDEIKQVFKKAYSYNFRFQSFMSAFKFYNDYALRTNDKKTFLERYEDRLAINALYHADGDVKKALVLIDQLMKQNFTPATPTLLNSGKARRGELVSCFVGDTLVREKEEFYKQIKDIKVGDYVLTNDSTYKKVTNISKRKYNDELIELTIIGHTKLIVTPEHPFLVKTRDISNRILDLKGKDGEVESLNIVWKHAKDLVSSDLVLVIGQKLLEEIKSIDVIDYVDSNYIESDGIVYKKTIDKKNNKRKGHSFSTQVSPINNTIYLNREFGELIGAFLAEGSYLSGSQTKGIRFTLNSQDTEYIESIRKSIFNIFGITPTLHENKDGSTNVDASSIILGKLFTALVGRGFDGKYISNDLYLNLNKEFAEGILKGLFRGDGCALINGMQLDMSNPRIMKQIRDIMYSVGLNPIYREYMSRSGTMASTLRLLIRDSHEEDFVKYVGKNLDKINFDYYKNESTLKYSVTKETIRHNGNIYLLNKVKSVKVLENEDEIYVYNLHVEDNHTYVVNNIVVHNCFLLGVNDSLTDIYKAVDFASQLSKRGGGVALNLTALRARGETIKKVKGASSGVVPVMKLLEDTFNYVDQLG